MSAEELPCLKQLEQHAQNEARRMSERFKESDLAELDAVPPHSEPNQADQPKQEEQGKQEEAEVRLNLPVVDATAPRPNIFAQREDQPKINIFGNSKSVNLFSLNQQTPSSNAFNIFTKAVDAPPAISSTTEEELSEGSLSSSRSQQIMKEPTERIMKYTYEEWKREGEWRVSKFRAGMGAVKEGVLVSLERRPQMEQVLFLIVRSEATKVVLYHAVLLPGTRVEQFMGKKENLKLTVLYKQQSQSKSKEENGTQEEKQAAKEEKSVGNEEEKQEEKAAGEAVKEGEREGREQVKLQFEREEDAASFNDLARQLSANK